MRATRLLTSVGVVLAGVLAALPFRQEPPPSPPPRLGAVTPLALTLRKPDAPLELAPRIEVSPATELDSVGDRGLETGDRRKEAPDLTNLAPPPALPVSFQPSAAPAPTSDWKPEALTMTPPRPQAKPRPYRLRDGDTLEKIAERLLGDPSRAAEIFQSNRDILTRPDLLPVGVVIKLPPRPDSDLIQTTIPNPHRLTAPNN